MGWCRFAFGLFFCALSAGCGTSVWSDTKRTATEQLLISDAIDRAVSELDFRALAGKPVFLDNQAVRNAVDSEYLTSSVRQHMLANGCVLREKAEEAEYIVELRAGAIGTDRHDVLYGVPSVNVPTVLPVSGMPNAIPEIPLAKKTDQRAVCKIAVFAYNRTTGRPVWQSGIVPAESLAKDFWFFGAGPFQRGTIYEGMSFAGDKLEIPLANLEDKLGSPADPVAVADEAYFTEPVVELAGDTTSESADSPDSKVVPASASQPSPEPPSKKSPPESAGTAPGPNESAPAPAEAPKGQEQNESRGAAAGREPGEPALLSPEPLPEALLRPAPPEAVNQPPTVALPFKSLILRLEDARREPPAFDAAPPR